MNCSKKMHGTVNKFITLILAGCTIGWIVGCSAPAKKEQVTYNADIAPLLYKNCSPCHHPGSAGPFNLLAYEDAVRHAQTIVLSVKTRFMPPWPADPEYSHFREEKRLTDEEIKTIETWVTSGMEEGDPSLRTNPPIYPNGSSIGKPDYSVTLPTRFLLPGDNKDRFMMMKVPVELDKDTFVRVIEIIPGNKKLVHHINGHLIQYDAGRKQKRQAGVPAVDTEVHDKSTAYQLLDLPNDDGSYPLLTPSVTNYLPGVEPSVYPNEIGGYRIKKNSALLLDNIHYGPTPIDTSDLTTFNFFFMPSAPKRPTREFILGTSGISPIVPPLVIAPGKVQSFTTRYVVPETISLLTINPHMHLLGVSFKAYGLSPAGDTIRLISIPKWDFRWQYFYTFEKTIVLQAGTTLIVEGVFDNTENNPLNPFHPPRTISEREGSMRTTDEMFQLICTYIPYQSGDETISLTIENK
jgi:mono/diheme cytochrome c family protein